MPGKRKRSSAANANADATAVHSEERNVKPISAVAAAKLRSQPFLQEEVPSIENPSSANSLVSSEIEGEEGRSLGEDEASVPQPNVQLCTWRYGPDYVSSESEEQVTICLKKGATITLIGCFDFTVLRGAININGANFGAVLRRGEQPKTSRAYVLSTHPISVIKGLDSENEIQFLSCPETTPLGSLNPLFRNIWNAKPLTGRAKSFSLITESDADPLHRPLTPEIIPDDWVRQVDECAATFNTTLVIGPPSSGKSNFAKRLLNRYLTGHGRLAQPISSALFLDLDTSKPAYTPHGQISLVLVRQVDLGPPYTHPHPLPKSAGGNEIVRSHPVPVHNTLNYLDHFLAGTRDLLRTFQGLNQQQPSGPLIVNTPGWLYTSTFSTLLDLLPLLKPRNLVVLADASSIDVDTASKLHTLDTASRKLNAAVLHISAIPAPPTPSPYTDAHHRDMHMQSYFHLRLSKSSEPAFSSLPLTHLPPWEFFLNETETSPQSLIGVIALCDPSSLTPPNSLQTILNGAIVHIMDTSDPDIIGQYGTLPRTQDRFGIPYFPVDQDTGAVKMLDPASSRIVATALVRGWDVSRGVVQLLVPKGVESVMTSLRSDRTVWVVGACEGAGWAYVEEAEYVRSEGGGVEGQELDPWVERREVVEGMGYLCVPRRVRRFQQ
ncbi:uncharacterized protein EI97DRAFT_465822 [Westerdykella ornata]|uniref:Polynucleotide 5'-hydroxyl-kinase GRC3 n=1 Tax=Westerdykella ornata TaxID=318751 RepID=A0A6A6JPK2_WESOR|nr:uncharacterized protein EI97DRAFT_465822 [Westerdykella ornata]KAF2278541.1 hypothetical protein EI97DRAFT_465822 [Westerdykella ornata]